MPLAVLTLSNAETESKTGAVGAPKVSIHGASDSPFEGAIPQGHAVLYPKPLAAKNGVDSPEKPSGRSPSMPLAVSLRRRIPTSGATISFTGYGKVDYSDRSFVVRASDLGHPDGIGMKVMADPVASIVKRELQTP